jgi:hypothetical protein
MATLSEDPTYHAGIYQLERTDPAEAGEDGILNTPLRQLAERTKYLKGFADEVVEARGAFASLDGRISSLGSGGGGGGGGWQMVAEFPHNTLTGWTSRAGTWSVTDGVLRQETTDSLFRLLGRDYVWPAAVAVGLEMEVQFETIGSPNSANRYAGAALLRPTFQTTNNRTGYLHRDTSGVWRVGSGQQFSASQVSPALSGVGFDEWIPLFVSDNGIFVGASCDDIRSGIGYAQAPQAGTLEPGLCSFGIAARFRNIRAWIIPAWPSAPEE